MARIIWGLFRSKRRTVGRSASVLFANGVTAVNLFTPRHTLRCCFDDFRAILGEKEVFDCVFESILSLMVSPIGFEVKFSLCFYHLFSYVYLCCNNIIAHSFSFAAFFTSFCYTLHNDFSKEYHYFILC